MLQHHFTCHMLVIVRLSISSVFDSSHKLMYGTKAEASCQWWRSFKELFVWVSKTRPARESSDFELQYVGSKSKERVSVLSHIHASWPLWQIKLVLSYMLSSWFWLDTSWVIPFPPRLWACQSRLATLVISGLLFLDSRYYDRDIRPVHNVSDIVKVGFEYWILDIQLVSCSSTYLGTYYCSILKHDVHLSFIKLLR